MSLLNQTSKEDNMYLVIVNSESCHGWEENTVEVEKTEHSNVFDCVVDLIKEEYDVSKEEGTEILLEREDFSGFGYRECNRNSTQIDFDGNDVTTSYFVISNLEELLG